MCPTTATVSPFLPDFHPATTRPPAAPAATLPKQRKSRGNEVDIRDHRQMVGSIKPDVKAILPTPRSVQKAISYQLSVAEAGASKARIDNLELRQKLARVEENAEVLSKEVLELKGALDAEHKKSIVQKIFDTR